MSAKRRYEAAAAAFADFFVEWFEKKGGTRAEGVTAAWRAADAIENIWDVERELSAEQIEAAEQWLEYLLHVPEIEKEWFGLAEYRENHRVKTRETA